jgi:CheY-like chemotaxis protein
MQTEHEGRVLLIDDEPVVVRVIEHVLKRVCEVESVTDGVTALQRLRDGHPFALVLCDLNLPRLDGLRLLELIRREMPALAERFVILTGGTTTLAGGAQLALAGVPVMEKPFHAKELIAMVRRYLPTQKNGLAA